MSPATWERIRTAIQSLDFRPNSIARGLVTNRTATIGLILAEIETPLFLQALHLIEPIARDGGYNILLCIARNVDDEHAALNLLLEKQVDGAIFLSTSHYTKDDHLLELDRAGLPVVLVNRANRHDCFDQINWDNQDAVAQLVDHLAHLGHRRIAHLRGPKNRLSAGERLTGYQMGLELNGLRYDESLVRSGDFTAPQSEWRQATIELLRLSPRPTAIIASDDIVAASVMQTVESLGLHVGKDIAVVGIDDQPFSAYLNPPLTTARLPVEDAGRRAIEMLLDRIAGKRKLHEHITLPCPIIVRESSRFELDPQVE